MRLAVVGVGGYGWDLITGLAKVSRRLVCRGKDSF
jgi:hypothetical protein